MEAAEEILIANYYVEMNGDDTASIIKAMKAYAMQECEKVRRDCADNAEIKSVTSYPNFPKVFVKTFKEKKDSVVGIEETLTICKDSILDTPITLS